MRILVLLLLILGIQLLGAQEIIEKKHRKLVSNSTSLAIYYGFVDTMVGSTTTGFLEFENTSGSPIPVLNLIISDSVFVPYATSINVPAGSPPANRAEIDIDFTPTAPKQYRPPVTVITNTDTLEFEFIALGLGALLVQDSLSVQFLSTPVERTGHKLLSIKNEGNIDLTIDSSSVGNPFFHDSPFVIAPEESLTVDLFFSPTEDGTYSSQISWYSNDFRGEQSFSATGVAEPKMALNLSYLGQRDSPGSGSAIIFGPESAYMADGNRGIRILSVSDPFLPRETGYAVQNPGLNAYDVDIQNDYLFATTTSASIKVLSIEDSSLVAIRRSVNLAGSTKTIQIQGFYAYVAAGAIGGIQILNISDPLNISQVGFFDSPGAVHDLFIRNIYCYLADMSGGFRIVDISNFAFPQEVGNVDGIGTVNGIFLEAASAYAISEEGNLMVVDINDPAAPQLVSTTPVAGTPSHIVVEDMFVYISTLDEGLRVFDVSSPTNPQEVAYFKTFDGVGKVAIQDSLVYVPAGTDGMYILKHNKARTVTGIDEGEAIVSKYTLSQNYPNPFNPSTTIRFETGRGGMVQVSVYNISGQQVKKLVAREVAAGFHEVIWDATDADGNAASSGIYFYRLETESFSEVKRMILLR